MENFMNSPLTLPMPSNGVAGPLSLDKVQPAPRPAAPVAGHVLVPFHQYDVAGELTTALEIAASLRPGALVTLLRVLSIQPEPVERSFHWLDAIERLHRERKRCQDDVLEKARAALVPWIEQEVPARFRGALTLRAECRAGDPADEIARFANEQSVDLVVLTGERDRSRWMFWRPLFDRVLRLTDRPVIISTRRRSRSRRPLRG